MFISARKINKSHLKTKSNYRFCQLDLLDKGPIIEGASPSYRIGEMAELNCTYHKSNPVARLTWQINGRDAPGFASDVEVICKG